jgi:hypothetical protein
MDEGKTFLDSGSDTKETFEKKLSIYDDYEQDEDLDDNYEPKQNFATMSLMELRDYIHSTKNVRGKAVEACIIHVTKDILKDRYKDLIVKNGVVLDTVKKRCYFLAKGKKLKKSIGSILLYKPLKTTETQDFKDYKFYVVLYNYESYIEKKQKEFETIKEILKANSIELRLLSDLVK